MPEPTDEIVVLQQADADVTTRYQAAIRLAELVRALYLEPNGTLAVRPARPRRRKPRGRAVLADALREWEEVR